MLKSMLLSFLFLLGSIWSLSAQQNNNISIRNVEQINTPALDFSPVFYHQGLVYVSSEKRTGKIDTKINENTFDLLYSDLGYNKKLSKPAPFSLKVNTRFHEGPVSFSPDMYKMYFTRNNLKNGVPVKDQTGTVRLKIYEATRGKDDWENIIELPFNNDQYSCVHPSISYDGKYLFFASDRPGGYGGMDLYYAIKTGNEWSEPINLGKEVNTAAQEQFPYFHSSGKLFFASNRSGSMGGLDIYSVDFNEKVSGSVEHLPAPINSESDDLGLVLNRKGKLGYFASDRPGGKGKDDIYRIDIEGGLDGLFPPKNFDLVVKVFSKETGEGLSNAKLALLEVQEGQSVFDLDEIFEVSVIKNEDGDYLLRYAISESLFENEELVRTDKMGINKLRVKETRYYLIAAQKEGFKSAYTNYLAVDAKNPGAVAIGLWPMPKVPVEVPQPVVLEVGSIIVLDQIYYDFAKSYIRTDASKGLDAILELMTNYPAMTIELTSHTDSRGSKEFNLDLSVRRSASAKYYLTSRGIDESRIKAYGKGEQYPRNRCQDGVNCSEEEHQYNRRTEIKITSLGPDVKKIEYLDNAPEYIDRAKFKK